MPTGNRRALVFAMAGRDPRIDEAGEAIEAAVAGRARTYDALVFRIGPHEIEVTQEQRIARHRRHLAFGPAGGGVRMATAPSAAFSRRASVNIEQRLDLRHPRCAAQVAQVQRVEAYRS